MLQRLRVLGSEGLIYGVSGIVTRFLSVWLVPIYTRLFSQEDYGVLSLVTSTVAMVSIFAGLALDNSAARWFWDTEDESERKRSIASGALCQLAFSTLLGIGLYLASDMLAARVVGRADSAEYFRLMSLTLPLSQLGTVVVGWLRMQRRAVATAAFTFGTSLLQIGLTLFLVVGLKYGLRGVYLSQVINLAVSSVVAVILLRDWVNPAWFSAPRLKEMLWYALPLIPSGVALWVVGFADRYFVKMFGSTSEVGLFSVGTSLAQGMYLLTGAFQLAWGPFALSIHKEPDAKQTYAQVFLVYLASTTFIACGLALFSPEILRILATEKFVGSYSVVGLMALSYAMIGLSYIASTGPAVMKTTAAIGIAVSAAAVLNLVLNFLLVPRYGKVGAAVATLAAQSFGPLVLFWRAHRIYPIPYRFSAGLSFIGLSLTIILIGIELPLPGWGGAAIRLLMLASYIPLLYALKVLTPARTRAFVFLVRTRLAGMAR